MAWLRWGSVCLAGLLAGCTTDDGTGDATSIGTLMDDLPPSTNCPGGTDTGACADDSGSASAGGAGSCQSGSDCMTGEGCLAPFDGEIGEFACVPGCIGIMDDDWWCADASACCDQSATCTMRGYCVLPEAGSDGSGGSGTSTEGGTAGSDGTTAGSDGGTTTGGSSGTG